MTAPYKEPQWFNIDFNMWLLAYEGFAFAAKHNDPNGVLILKSHIETGRGYYREVYGSEKENIEEFTNTLNTLLSDYDPDKDIEKLQDKTLRVRFSAECPEGQKYPGELKLKFLGIKKDLRTIEVMNDKTGNCVSQPSIITLRLAYPGTPEVLEVPIAFVTIFSGLDDL